MNKSVLSVADTLHRENFREFVVEKAEPWHREHLGRLYSRWEQWNRQFFDGSMVAPYILFSVTNYTGALGDYSTISGFGGRGQIRIRESLLTGTHRSVRAGEKFAEGRIRFVEDVLLHETIHQFQHEVILKNEKSYKGHGPVFRDNCNRIGGKLDLSPVRVAKTRGKSKSLPSCSHWPHCVRPQDYYSGAFIAESEKSDIAVDEESEADSVAVNDKFDKLAAGLNALAAGAQQFARFWPSGSEEEAAASFAGGGMGGGLIERKLAALCVAAREFDDVLK